MKGWLVSVVLFGTLLLVALTGSAGDLPPAQASPASAPASEDLELKKLDVEKYKAELDSRKFILTGVVAAIAIALIPPVFQLATAFLEYVKSRAQVRIDQQNKSEERLAKQEEFRESYIKEFTKDALNQDIELRIRFAEYFKSVSAESFRQGWIQYHDGLVKHRNEIREQINRLEAEWRKKAHDRSRGIAEIDELERNLRWAYNEVGYIERDRSVAADPRATAGSFAHGIALKDPNACATFKATEFRGRARPTAEGDYHEVSASLGVESAVLRAIVQIESGGSGFDAGRPKIKFERHYFHQLTNGQFSASNPEISSVASGGYGPTFEHEYIRLTQAMALDCGAALAATSWGLFQILGMMAAGAGFRYVDEFVTAQMDSERGQLEAGARLITANPAMADALRQKDWGASPRSGVGRHLPIISVNSAISTRAIVLRRRSKHRKSVDESRKS
jgi:hypothetical protein